jgi:hypothetical protein
MLNTIPQQKFKTMKKIIQDWWFELFVLTCLAIGVLMCYLLGSPFKETLCMQGIGFTNNMLIVGLTATVLLFVGGVFYGRFKK